MTKQAPAPLFYGDGAAKIFGMENFGNTCYCNSILQCLYFTDKFRLQLLQYNNLPHERRTTVTSASYHTFTAKYEQLVAKRLKEQGKTPVSGSDSANGGSAVRPLIRSSIFGKFTNSTPQTAENGGELAYMRLGYVQNAVECTALSTEQRLMVKKHPELHHVQVLVTRPSVGDSGNDNSNSQSSATLLDQNSSSGTVQPGESDGVLGRSSIIVVGIPHPEKNLAVPINPFNANPTSDQRKRLALINGPILNLDKLLQPEAPNEDTVLLYALKDLFESMVEHGSQIGVVSPHHFVAKLKEKNFLFRQVNMHQDAHEFCNYLVNEIIESVNHELGSLRNWCTDIFGGTITNETKCLTCETITSIDELFLDLSIDIPPGTSAYLLAFSLNNFSRLETLNHQNKFYCNTCLALQEALKTIKLKKTPEVLVINFKRFKYDDKLDRMVKLFDLILYPLKLRLFNTTTHKKSDDSKEEKDASGAGNSDRKDDFSLYGLYALVVHIGGGPMHGHYVALCKGKAGLWFLFDDETVEIVDELYVLRFFGNGPGLASAYILFYEKLDTRIDDDLDFGIDMQAVYNGLDYSVAMQPVSSETSVAADSVENEDSEEDSIKDFTQAAESGPGTMVRKTSIFKKTFMFDSSGKEVPEDTVTKSVSRSSSTKDTEGPLGTTKTGGIFEKKSWVNGLKRRELKNDVTPQDRKALLGSLSGSIKSDTNSDPARRRSSIFSFKRKGKS